MLTVIHIAPGATASAGERTLVETVRAQLALGHTVTAWIVTPDETVTPARAGRLLGVSRQLIDRLIKAGKLPVTRLPGSTHRRVPLAALEVFLRERDRRRRALDGAVAALDEAGVPWE